MKSALVMQNSKSNRYIPEIWNVKEWIWDEILDLFDLSTDQIYQIFY